MVIIKYQHDLCASISQIIQKTAHNGLEMHSLWRIQQQKCIFTGPWDDFLDCSYEVREKCPRIIVAFIK